LVENAALHEPRRSPDESYEITDSFGSPSDGTNVKAYLAAPLDASFEIYIYVGRIPLANFYAHASQQFDKNSLWQEIQQRANLATLPQPKKWDVASTLMDLALWVHAEVSA
jgi:hypothetical protein